MMASCSTALVRQAPRRALVASPSGRAVVARGFTEDAKQSVEPRVEQLREAQLNQTTSFMDIMRFSGPAPELINGRLAMFGFFAAMCAELSSQETAFQQFADAPGAILCFSGLIIVASIIPIVRKSPVVDNGTGEGFKPGAFNVTNELLNGRAGMLGLLLLLFYEAVTKQPLF